MTLIAVETECRYCTEDMMEELNVSSASRAPEKSVIRNNENEEENGNYTLIIKS